MTTTTTATGTRAAPATGAVPPFGGWADVLDVRAPDARALAAVAAAAIATDAAVRSGVAVLAGTLLVAVVAGGVVASGRVVNRRAWPLLAAAPCFGVWLALRSSPWLLPLDVIAAASLLVLASTLSRDGDPTDLTVPGIAGRAVHAAVHAVLAPGFLLRALRRRSGVHPGVLRGALLAAPVVALVGGLLASADAVFASFFRVPTDAGDLFVHALLLGVGAWGAAALLRVVSAAPYVAPWQPSRPLGTLEATIVAGALVAVFAVFTASQAVAAIRGDSYVLRTAGLTYAEYARTGFFQLLAVAAITLTVLLAVRATVDRADDAGHRRFVLVAEVAVVLTLVVVAVALRRLHLYEQAYGLTMLRLASTLFALWIGAVFLALAVALGGVGTRRDWLVPAAAGLALVGLFLTNASNPEAFVVRRNVERFGTTAAFDVDYLAGLSDDAVPALVDALDDLPPQHAVALRDQLCASRRGGGRGFLAHNESRARANEALARVCTTREA